MEDEKTKVTIDSMIESDQVAISEMEVGSEERGVAIEHCAKLCKIRDEHLAVVNESQKIAVENEKNAVESKKNDDQRKGQMWDRISKFGFGALALAAYLWITSESIRSDRDPSYLESETTKNQKRSIQFNPFKIF